MSLTAALRPMNFSFPGTSTRPHASQREGARPFHHEPAYINLNRMLIRYQHLILLTPDPALESETELTPLQRQIQADLWSPLPYHRTKWLHNIDGARSLLLQLERAAQNIRVQRHKQNALKDLPEKRIVIKRLRNRIEEIGREVEAMGDEAFDLPQDTEGRESVYDILRKRRKEKEQSESKELLQEGRPIHVVEEDDTHTADADQEESRSKLFNTSSAIRRRGEQKSPQSDDTGYTSGYSGVDAGERAMLDASRTQEDLTTSLVSMAAQLKQQARAFQFSLDKDKGLLDRALEGLDRNIGGMEAASKNMKTLTKLTEGEGFFGRLRLYLIIGAMWVAAILLVFVGPKLRF